ncbi:MAG TPA: DUF2059 domain-containing protein [Anaeromyxobacter sp.]|nr:DUF2059 domain-containing protein [Anaeromyxobacter sp.]
MRAPILALLVLASPALAAPPSATPGATPDGQAKAQGKPPTEQARALSRALVPETNWERLLDRSADGLSEAVSRSLIAKGEKVPDDLKTNLRKELGKDLKYGEAIDAQAQALDKRFTGDELKRATAFYSSPLGKKMLDRLPEAQSEVGDQLQERLASVVPGILQRVAPSAIGGGPADPGASGTGEGPSEQEVEPEPTPEVAPEASEPPPDKKL